MLPLLLLLFLMFSPAQSMPLQNDCATETHQNVSQPHYHDNIQTDTGVGFLQALVQSFLSTVQPNPFPQDLMVRLFQQFNQLRSNQDIIKEVLVYEVGFLVCIAIGVLYIVLMPIVGLCLACCRCFGKCGGKMYQKQTSSTNCKRRVFYWSMFVTTIVILVGNICMFKSNENLRMSVDRSPVEFQNTVDNINTFLLTVPQQIDTVVNESYKTVDEVTGNFNDIGQQLGTEIQKQFRGTLNPVLNSVKVLHQETNTISNTLKKINSTMEEMRTNMSLIQTDVISVRDRISQTLSDPNCLGCDHLTPELEKLTVDTSIRIPGFDDFHSAVEEVVRINLNSRISEVEDFFRDIPQTVTDDTKDIVQSSFQMLRDIKAQISQVSSDLRLSTLTKSMSQYVETTQTEMKNVLPHVQRAEQIRWAVCVALCSVVLLVVVCNLLGLVLGPLGLSPNADPTKRSSASNCGGTFLMMGAGFSFIFAWLFMIAVLILFLLGGNVYTLLCRPWSNGQLLEFIDTPGLIPELDLGPTLGLETKLNFSGIYRDCEKNNSLWTTLHLHEVINLEELLNVSKYTDEIKKDFENTVISLSSIVLLSTEVKTLLRSVSTKAEDFDSTPVIAVNIICDSNECTGYNHFLRTENPNVSGDSLSSTANELDRLAAAQSDVGIQEQLRSQARDLRRIEESIDAVITPQHEDLKGIVIGFESSKKKIIKTEGEVLSSVEAAQDFLNTNTAQIVKTESRKFVDRQLHYFISYADWAKHTLTQQVGRCGPVAGALDSVDIVLCAYIVESLNAFWFSLGWCTIFFIPGIIFSIKLSKFYRRMKDPDADLEGGTLAASIDKLPLHRMTAHFPPPHLTLSQEGGTRERRQAKIKKKRKRRKRRQRKRGKRPANPDTKLIDMPTKKNQGGLPEIAS